MRFTVFLSFSQFAILCIASPKRPITGLRKDPTIGTQESGCRNATTATHDTSCWAALGLNDWFDKWKDSCLGPIGCGCDSSNPWSDCVLQKYQIAIGTPLKQGVRPSCVDLNRNVLCELPASEDWIKFSDAQLAIAYASLAVGTFNQYVYDWYSTLTNRTAPPAVWDTLNEYLETDTNKTAVNTARYLTSLMSSYSINKGAATSFTGVMTKVIGENTTIDVTEMDMPTFQDAIGQALQKTLSATLSDWSTPFFSTFSKNGALVGTPLENAADLTKCIDQPTPSEDSTPFEATGKPGDMSMPAISNATATGRTLLSTDYTDDYTDKWGIQIRECNAGEPGGMAEQIGELLDEIHENLSKVVVQVIQGTNSRYGYKQIFKNSDNVPKVKKLFKQLYAGVGTRGNEAASQAVPDNPPVLVCLQPNNPNTIGAYGLCQVMPNTRAFQQPGTPYAIGLCPSFWALPPSPVRPFCPYEGNDNGRGPWLQLNRQSAVVREIIRLYLGASVLMPERNDMQDVVELSAEEAYWNPSSYGFLYASVVGCLPDAWDHDEL